MAHKLESLLKILTDKKNKFLNNGTFMSKYNMIGKQINDKIIMFQDLKASQSQENTPLPKKLVKWWQWYEKLIGLDAIEMSKHQVTYAQEKLFKCQNERRELNRLATNMNNNLKEIYSELILTKRDDPKYLQLTMIEHKALQDQIKLTQQINLLEEEEKQNFTLLTTAIKEYHDSQTLNAQKYKYLSIVASTTVAIVSLVISMIYNSKRITDTRNVISYAQDKNEDFFKETLHLISIMASQLSNMSERIQINNKDNRTKQVPTIVEENNEDSRAYSTYVKIGIGVFAASLLAMVIR